MYLCTCAAYIRVGNKTWVFSYLECEQRSRGVKGRHVQQQVVFVFILSTAFTYNQPFSVNHVEYLFSGSEVD